MLDDPSPSFNLGLRPENTGAPRLYLIDVSPSGEQFLSMPRIAPIIAPGIHHHVTQRGNRRMDTFFRDEDYQAYLALTAEWRRKCNVAVWAYCLMPNHVHLVAVPESKDGLPLAIGEAHRRYSAMVCRRQKRTGHLWQGRFSSFSMDEMYLVAAVKYIEMNPVRARRVADPYVWQ